MWILKGGEVERPSEKYGEGKLIRIYYMKINPIFNKRKKSWKLVFENVTFESYVHYKFIQFNFLLLILKV